MSTSRRALVALLVTALALATTACGGFAREESSESSGSSGPSMSTPSTEPPSTATPPDSSSDTTGTVPPSTSPPSTSPPTAAEIEWERCLLAECATLVVPLDYDDPGGETIELAIARQPAADPAAREGILLVNPGGPGGSGVDLLRSGWSLPGGLGERFDLVSWDPRGVGRSTRVTCGGDTLDTWLATDPDPDTPEEREQLEAAARALAEECAAMDGALLPHVSTLDAVEDMESIRVALGEDQLSYLGLSYGTLIGQHYLDAHPDRLRAMVLDGVLDANLPLSGLANSQAAGFGGALDRLAAACAKGDVECTVEDPVVAYEQLMAQAEIEPLPAVSGGVVGPAELITGVVYALYNPTTWPLLTDALAEALDGDASTIGVFARSYQSNASFTAYAAVVCIDFGPPADAEAFAELDEQMSADHPYFGGALANEMLPCAYWPVDPVRPPEPVSSPPGAPPVLIVSNLGDPATPPEEARNAAERIDGVRLDHDGEGHLSTGSNACVDAAIEAYFTDLTLPAEGTVCD